MFVSQQVYIIGKLKEKTILYDFVVCIITVHILQYVSSAGPAICLQHIF